MQSSNKIKTILFRLLKVSVSGALILYMLNRIGLERIADQLRNVDWSWIAAGLCIFTLSHLLGSVQWMQLLHARRIPLSWKQTLSYYYVGLFFNNFLISNLGGDVFRVLDIRKLSGDGSGAVSTVMLDRILGLFVLSALAIFSAPFWISKAMPSGLIALLSALTAAWLIILVVIFNPSAGRIMFRLFNILPERFRQKLEGVYQGIRDLAADKRLMSRLLMISAAVQVLRIFMHYCAARALGVQLSPGYFLVIIPVIAIAASLPISFGGIGVREQTGIILFGILGVSAIKSFSIEFIAYLIAVVSSLPGGIQFALRKTHLEGLKRQREEQTFTGSHP